MFSPLKSRNDTVVSGFEIGLQQLTNDWFVCFLHWDLATGGVADTPFARVTGHLGPDKACAVTLVWMLAEAPEEEVIQRVLGQLRETLRINGEIRIAECAVYRSLFPASDGREFPPGRFNVSRTERTEVSRIHEVRFLPEEHFKAGQFDDDKYRSVATIETFAQAAPKEGDEVVFVTVCVTAPEWASPQAANWFVNWFDGLLNEGAKQERLFARSANIFLVHALYIGTAQIS